MKTARNLAQKQREERWAERRSSERRPVAREGWLRVPDGTIIGVVLSDLSYGGAGVDLLVPHEFTRRECVELALEDVGADDLWFPCVVRWQSPTRIGLQFYSLTAKAKAAIAKLLAPPPLPHDDDDELHITVLGR